MSYVELRPHNARPVQVLVDGVWWHGILEAFSRECDGNWRGCVRWFESPSRTRIGWFSDRELSLLPRRRSDTH